MKRFKKLVSILSVISLLVASSIISVSAKSGYAYTFGASPNPHTVEEIEKFAYWWKAAGLHSYWSTENTYDYVNSDRLNSTVVCLVGHGSWECVQVTMPDHQSVITVMNTYNNRSENVVGLKSRGNLSDVRLAMFSACETANETHGRNICQVAVDLGADSAVGFRDAVGVTPSVKWQDRFGYRVSHGYTVANAVNYANSFNDYGEQGVRTAKYYGNGNTTIKVNTRSLSEVSEVIEDETTIEVCDFILTYESDLQLLTNLLETKIPNFNKNGYIIKKTSTSPDNQNFIVDYIETVDGYETDSMYTVVCENNKVQYIRNNTLSRPNTLSNTSHRKPTETDIQTAQAIAEQAIVERNDGSSIQRFEGQNLYDIHTGKYYYILTAVIDVGGGALDTLTIKYEIV